MLPLSEMETPEGQRAALISQWNTIAACAWDGYQRLGRGAVVLFAGKLDHVPDKFAPFRMDIPGQPGVEAVSYQIVYAPYDGDVLKANVDVVGTYDPNDSLVVLVLSQVRRRGPEGIEYGWQRDFHYIETPPGKWSPQKSWEKQSRH